MQAQPTRRSRSRRRLVGGLLRPIDPDDLKIAVRESLASVQLGESRVDQEFARHGARRGLAVIFRSRIRRTHCAKATTNA